MPPVATVSAGTLLVWQWHSDVYTVYAYKTYRRELYISVVLYTANTLLAISPKMENIQLCRYPIYSTVSTRGHW